MTRKILLLAAALLALPAAAKERADHYEAMTYNIRLDIASAGDNAWPHRRSALIAPVAYQAPDLVGRQEVLQHQKHAAEADLTPTNSSASSATTGRQIGRATWREREWQHGYSTVGAD